MEWQNEEQDTLEDLENTENYIPLNPEELQEEGFDPEGYEELNDNIDQLENQLQTRREDVIASRMEKEGKLVENAGRGTEVAGGAVQATGKGMEATGKGMQVAGKGVELTGQGIETAGSALNKGGQSLIETGTSLSSTGAGAVAGVPLMVIGGALTGAGVGTEAVGKATKASGKAIDSAGKSVDKAGKNIRQKGNQLRNKGKDIQNDANNLRKMKNSKRPNRLQGIVPKNKMGLPTKSQSNFKDGFSSIKNVKGTIKIPLSVKIILTSLIIGVPILGLMMFVAIFNEEGTGGPSSSAGSFMFGETCTSVTVNNTGCDSGAQNCSHVYDGEVEFEDYIAGVVAAEVGGANNLEYYKVAALAARTYFINNTSGNCTVNGNATFQAYMDVDDSANAELIRQAVSETTNQIIVEEGRLISTNYASACVVNADDDYYYVRYGTSSLGSAHFQQIPKEWDENESPYKNYLADWYSMTDQTNTDYENKSCPNNHDYGMSQLGALYLIMGEDYSYEEVIKYYYGENIEIVTNEMQFTGAEGFINPTRYIKCSSPFGYRNNPVTGKSELHTGVDIAIPGGEPVYAASNGVVRKVVNYVTGINNCNYGYGNYIIIDHADGMSTLYAHLKYGSIQDSIEAGTTVSQGEQIGQIGSTGCSTGNHLHYEVRTNDSHLDPTNYLDLTGATGTCKR